MAIRLVERKDSSDAMNWSELEVHALFPGGVRHEIRPIRMRHLQSDFRAWKELFSEAYVVKFSLYSKFV